MSNPSTVTLPYTSKVGFVIALRDATGMGLYEAKAAAEDERTPTYLLKTDNGFTLSETPLYSLDDVEAVVARVKEDDGFLTPEGLLKAVHYAGDTPDTCAATKIVEKWLRAKGYGTFQECLGS